MHTAKYIIFCFVLCTIFIGVKPNVIHGYISTSDGVVGVVEINNESEDNPQLVNSSGCPQSFLSNNDGWVTAPAEFTATIQDHSCREQAILIRLAQYESTFQNICNPYGYCGYFQIGAAAWTDCYSYGIYDESKCAITHFHISPVTRFESVQRNLNSFTYFLH